MAKRTHRQIRRNAAGLNRTENLLDRNIELNEALQTLVHVGEPTEELEGEGEQIDLLLLSKVDIG